MGKGKRTKDNNAAELFATANSKKKNEDKMGVWTKVLLISVVLIIVASLALTYISTSGILLRAPKAFKSENFEINGAMAQYMFYAQYTNFASSYSSYMSYMGLDTSKSLKAQTLNDTAKSLLAGMYGEDANMSGTWFDFFWSVTKNQATQTLAFCEAAKKNGMELTKEEKATIDESLKAIDETAALYGFPSTKSYITAMYGAGVTKSDIKKTLLLTELSAKYYEAEITKIEDGITDKQVEDYLAAHKSDFLKADYYSFTFQAVKPVADANDDDAKKAEKLAKFEKAIADAKANAEAVSKMTDIEAIKEYMVAYWADDYYEEYLASTHTELKKNDSKTGKPTITDADIPTDEAVLAANKDKVIDTVKAAIKNNTADADLKAFGNTAYDKVLASLRDKLITQIKKNLESMLTEKAAYSTESDTMKWIFDDARKTGDVKIFSDDDAESFKADDANTSSCKVIVYRIEKPQYLEDEKTKEFGHILINDGNFESDSHEGHDHAADDKDAISKENDAKAKAEAERLLAEFNKGEKTKDAFEALAKDKNQDGNVFYPDTKPGTMVEEMDEFLFSAKIGDTKVIKTTYGYHVTWLVGEGKEVYLVDAKDAYYAEQVEKWSKDTVAAYTITVNADIANKLAA